MIAIEALAEELHEIDRKLGSTEVPWSDLSDLSKETKRHRAREYARVFNITRKVSKEVEEAARKGYES